MPVLRDIEQGNPEEEDNSKNDGSRVPLLGAGCSGNQLSTNRNHVEVHRDPLGAVDSQPSTSTSANDNNDSTENDPEVLEIREAMGRLIKEGAELASRNDQNPLLEDIRLRDLGTLIEEIGPDVKDGAGKTVLRAAIDADWFPGVHIALNAGADVTIQAADGETPLHAAVAGITCHNKNLRKTMLKLILIFAEQTGAVNCLNRIRQTALFYAVRSGHLWCVEQFLVKRASLICTDDNELSVFHIAAECENEDILIKLLDIDEETIQTMINSRTISEGFAPIHFAVSKENLSCVKILQSKNANVCLTTSSGGKKTPLHMAIDKDNYEIAKCILSTHEIISALSEPSPVDEVDGQGWFPLHSAIHKGSENFIKLLLKHNASLTAQIKLREESTTALDMIMQYVTNPKEFLKDVLDSYISLNGSKNKVKIDYKLVMNKQGVEDEMNVIAALLNTGNELKQKKLLLHPLIESYIYLVWKKLMRIYLLTAANYLCFLIILAFSASIVFGEIESNRQPNIFMSYCISFMIILIVACYIFQEVLMNVEGWRYFRNMENIVKLGSLVLAIIFALVIRVQGWEEVARQLITWALLLACFQMLNILSQYPHWGYYVVIFNKVLYTVFKILATFAVLIIGFALSFKIQFHSRDPFDNVWHAIVKTFVLLTSEFNYEDLFKANNSTNPLTSGNEKPSPNEGARIIFAFFLVIIAIVLINVTTGVAVDDISDLKADGKVGMLEKQVIFIRSLMKFSQNITRCNNFCLNFTDEEIPSRLFSEINPIILLKNSDKMPKRFKDAFFKIAKENNDKDKEELIRKVDLDQAKSDAKIKSSFIDETTTKISDINSKVAEILQILKSSNKEN